MASIRKFSLRTLLGRLGQSFRRFPLSMLFVTFLTCFIISMNHGTDVGAKMEFFLLFYPATAALLALALTLLTEDFRSRLLAIAVQVGVHALWLAASVYLSQFDRFSLPQYIATGSAVAAIGLSVFLLCFYRRNDDVPFWYFSVRTVMALAVSAFIGGVLCLGLLALTESLKMLFSLHIDVAVYPDIWTVCLVLLAPMLFMLLIPKGEDKRVTTVYDYPRFARGVVQYLFLPLLGLYLLTLYAYAAKILMEWTLPLGGVSYLVTGSMVLMVLLIYLTYPIQHLNEKSWFKRVTRWLPVVMLPLLALMTIAIWRRLSDYGITVSRLYLLVFNLWCYAVCLWLIFTRNKRLWPIPASFAIILLLISVGPQSIANVTQRQLKTEARNAFTASGVKQLPLSGEQYDKWLSDADPKVAAAIDSKLHYLQSDFGYATISDLLEKDVIVGRYSMIGEDGTPLSTKSQVYSNDNMISDMTVPHGYRTMSFVQIDDENIYKFDGDNLLFKLEDENEVEHCFELDVKQLAERDNSKNQDGSVPSLMLDNGEALLAFNSFQITVYPEGGYYFYCTGILFTR